MRILLAGLVYFGSLMAAARADQPASFDEAVAYLEHRPGFVDLYLDAEAGAVFAALPAPDEDGIAVGFIHTVGLTGGLGSNPIGLDRGNATNGAIVRFRRIGNQVVAEQENWRYRASARPNRQTRATALDARAITLIQHHFSGAPARGGL